MSMVDNRSKEKVVIWWRQLRKFSRAGKKLVF